MSTATKSSDAEPITTELAPRPMVERWSKPVVDRGFVFAPNLLLQHQNKLGLDPKTNSPVPITSIELNLIMQILSFWWDKSLPFPSKKTLAVRLGVNERTIQRCIASLKKKSLLETPNRVSANNRTGRALDLAPLKRRLSQLEQNLPPARKLARDDDPEHLGTEISE